jgi:hypothetical protein
MPAAPTLCPSATLASVEPDQKLHISGLVGRDGIVTNLRTPLPVDAAMRAELQKHAAPERQFRFSAPCAEHKCGNWTQDAGGQCGLIARIRTHVAASAAAPLPSTTLPPCAIRAACRWWQQDGPAACAVCPLVTYNAADS